MGFYIKAEMSTGNNNRRYNIDKFVHIKPIVNHCGDKMGGGIWDQQDNMREMK